MSFQKRAKPEQFKEVGLAIVKYDGLSASCSCDWVYLNASRQKVLDDAIDRHLNKRHNGRGIRL